MMDALFSGELVWRESMWLWLLIVPVLMVIIQRIAGSRQRQSYADSHLWAWVASDTNQPTLVEPTRPGVMQKMQVLIKQVFANLMQPSKFLALAWICLVIAMAGPRSLDSAFDVDTRYGVDVMIDMDLSLSMTAEDRKPNRFLFAKSIAESLVNTLEPNDRVALNVFAGQPHTVIPLTYDKNAFQRSLNLIEPGMLPTKGSWLDLALIGALNTLTQTGRKAKVLVVFTDGAPRFWKPVPLPKFVQSLAVAKSQRQSDTGVKVIYVGVGQPRSSVIPDASDSSGKLHANGLLVQTRLEEAQLIKLAQQTEGLYLRAEPGEGFMQTLLAEIEQTASAYQHTSSRQVWIDYAYPFVVVGVFALLLAFYGWQVLLGMSQSGSNIKQSILKKIKRVDSSTTRSSVGIWLAIPLVVMSMTTLWPVPGVAASQKTSLKQAYQAFDDQSFELAQSLYDVVPNYAGWFGAGASAYRLGDLETAVLYFRQAAWQAPSDLERAKALLNLGNSYAKANLLPQAIESFEQALLYKSPYNKALHNLKYVQQRYQLELQGLLQSKEAKKKEGKGGKGDNSEGAFYGGQKPNSSDSDQSGFGADGDALKGERNGNKVNLPDADQPTDYRLNPSIAKLRLNSQQDGTEANKVWQVQRNQQRAEKFEHELQQLKDDQKNLLKRLFEREEGFQAEQEKAHAIPGVQPW